MGLLNKKEVIQTMSYMNEANMSSEAKLCLRDHSKMHLNSTQPKNIPLHK